MQDLKKNKGKQKSQIVINKYRKKFNSFQNEFDLIV